MKIHFRGKFTDREVGVQSFQVMDDEFVMTILKGEDILELNNAAFTKAKHGWYSHLYTNTRCYTGMSGNGSGVLNRTRKHLDPKNTVEYKDGIETVVTLTCKHKDLSTDVLFALEHTFTQLSVNSITHKQGVRNATGTHFNLKNSDEVYDWARAYAVYYTMFIRRGMTQYIIEKPELRVAKGPKMFTLGDTNVVMENYEKKKLRIVTGSYFPVPENLIIESCESRSIFNELVKSNIVIPYYNQSNKTIELLFIKDYNITKRFNLDELTSLFLDETVNDAADKWKNKTVSLKTYQHGNNN